MNSTFITHAESNGDKGKKWLKKIPNLIKEYEKKWSIKVSLPFELSYNYVAPAVREDGSPVVLKIGFPKDREFKSEIEALEAYGGRGAVRLIETDRPSSVILIEKLTPGTPLSNLKDDDEATRIISSLIRTLVRPLPEKNKFIPITEWIKAIPEYLEKYKTSDSPLPIELIKKANKTFEELIASSAQAVLIHGDLHHDNILKSEEYGWIAIDPKGIAAEREYETAAMIRNPYNRMQDLSNLPEILKRRIQILSAELNFDPERIRRWGFAQSVLSGVWNDAGVKESEHSFMIAKTLDNLKM